MLQGLSYCPSQLSKVVDLESSYFDIIKDPMDLCTMGAKLEDGMYKDRFAFQDDFRLMVSNAQRYNVPGCFAHNAAIALETFFEKCLCYTYLMTEFALMLSQYGQSSTRP